MKVALLAENMSFGGINRYCLDLVEALSHYTDIEIELFALTDKSDQWLLKEALVRGIDVRLLHMRMPFDFQVIWKLRQILREEHVDILHTQAYRGNLISRLTARLGGIKTKLICTVHGAYQISSASACSKAYYYLDYYTLSLSDHIIFVSESTQSSVNGYCSTKSSSVIHNGTQLITLPDVKVKQAARRHLNIPDSTKVISFVGRLSPQKGIETLVAGMRMLLGCTINTKCLIVGDGQLRPLVENLALEFPGRVSLFGAQHNVSIFYQVSDVLLIPSPMEGLPMVLLEAAAHGIPVVASNVGGIPEVVKSGHNGFLFTPLDYTDMSRRTLQLLGDSKLQAEFGLNARTVVEQEFSLRNMADKTQTVYTSTITQSA